MCRKSNVTVPVNEFATFSFKGYGFVRNVPTPSQQYKLNSNTQRPDESSSTSRHQLLAYFIFRILPNIND